MVRRGAAIAALFLLTAPCAAWAQGFDAQLTAGLYAPVKDQASHTDPTTGQATSYHLGSAPALGGRVTAWLSPVFGVEVEGVYAQPTRTEQSAASVTSPATTTLLAFKAVRRFRLGEATMLRAGIGVAHVGVGGVSYDTATVPLETSTTGAVLSASLMRTLRPRWSLVLGLEDWIYNLAEVRLAPSLTPSGTETFVQNDFVFSVGIAVRF